MGAYTARPENQGPAETPALTSSEAACRFLTYDANTGKYGYADESGTMIIEPRFQRAGQFLEGLAPAQVQSDSGSADYGYINTTGTFVIEPRFKTAFAFSEGLARVEIEIDGLSRYGFIDRSGAMVIEPQYVAAWDFSQGLARVTASDASDPAGYGFIDQTGTLVIGSRFESARDFSEGLAAVAIDGTWGYIDRAGDWVIEPRFPYAQSFVVSGLAAVDLECPGTAVDEKAPAGDSGLHQALIDKTGKVVWERQKAQE
ncbi:MAG: WG repeat-containing protein [Thermoleophilia bacterium]|nr:WG repeat-containing protein [Thermoleophilia bacterium]